MSRYVERAENATRILTVNFNALLDLPVEDGEAGWQPLVAITGDESLYHDVYNDFNARNTIEFMLWHPANPNSVMACVVNARENARSVREQISSEMWEHINRLYFSVRNLHKSDILRGPHEFFSLIRDGSHAFQGITNATMTHGEGYSFVQLGKYIERAGQTIRILDAKYASVNKLPEGSPETSLQLIAMLKSCSAFEAFRKAHASHLLAWRVAEFLLLNPLFPRAVRFCLEHCVEAVNAISASGTKTVDTQAGTLPQRLFGRLYSDLEYLDIRDVIDQSMHDYLEQCLDRISQAGDAVTRTFFSTQVIVPGPRSARSVMQSQQQQ
jgi:uncharacterized alpha-E superfamily protein